jgi:hypothetical protein
MLGYWKREYHGTCSTCPSCPILRPDVNFLADRAAVRVEVLVATQGGATALIDIRWLLTDILDCRVLTAAIC